MRGAGRNTRLVGGEGVAQPVDGIPVQAVEEHAVEAAGTRGVSVRGQRCTDGTQQGQAQRGTEEGAAGTVAGSHGLFSADAAGGGRRLTIPADWALKERPFSNEVRASY